MTLAEIDTRRIAGNAGFVYWYLSGDSHLVALEGPDGVEVWRFGTQDADEARAAYEHPFARGDVPNVFAK